MTVSSQSTNASPQCCATEPRTRRGRAPMCPPVFSCSVRSDYLPHCFLQLSRYGDFGSKTSRDWCNLRKRFEVGKCVRLAEERRCAAVHELDSIVAGAVGVRRPGNATGVEVRRVHDYRRRQVRARNNDRCALAGFLMAVRSRPHELVLAVELAATGALILRRTTGPRDQKRCARRRLAALLDDERRCARRRSSPQQVA